VVSDKDCEAPNGALDRVSPAPYKWPVNDYCTANTMICASQE